MAMLFSTERPLSNGTGAHRPVLARLEDGGFIQVWSFQDGTGNGVGLVRFDGGGNPHEAFVVNSTASFSQDFPAAAGLADGGFVVAWTSSGQDGSGDSVQMRRFNYNGTPQGLDVQVNSFTAGNQTEPYVAALPDGGFLVTWSSEQDGGGYGIYGQRYDAIGSPVGGEFRVNTTTAGNQFGGDSTSLAYGGWVTVWSGGSHNFAQLYTDGGVPIGTEIPLPATTTVTQINPHVVATPDGGFIVAYIGQALNYTGFFSNDIFARKFNSAGVAVGPEIPVNLGVVGTQQAPEIAVFPDGSFVVSWESFESAGVVGYVRKFAADGTPLTGELALNDPAPSNRFPSVVALADGGFAGAWNANGDVFIKQFKTSYNGLLTNGDNDAYGSDGNDSIYGRGGNDLILGMGGADYIDGGAGQDVMKGGQGFDAYVVDDAGDQVVELAGEGNDHIYTSLASYTLPSEVEQLTYTGSGGFAGTGNVLDNVIRGGALADTLDGGGGSDTLVGFEGDDTLIGGPGADIMYGMAGSDTFYVDNAADVVVEASGEGTFDTVLASLSYVLTAGAAVEIMRTSDAAGTSAINLTGNDVANIVYGNAGNNVLRGAGGDDQLIGNGGNDTLIGGSGNDVLHGTSGNATASYVDAVGGVTVSLNVAGTQDTGGSDFDTLIDISHLTGSNFADVLTGQAGPNVLLGGGGNDTLTGLEGNDMLNGGAGNDTMIGGLGNDYYFVDAAGDVVTEGAGQGTDTVYAAVSYGLAGGVEVETLQTTSASGTSAINLTGNEFGQAITGNAGANTLSGGGGNDILTGGTGNDTMIGGLGNDYYFVDAVGDIITEAPGQGTDTVYAAVSYTLAGGVEVEMLQTTSAAGTGAVNLTGNEYGQTITGNAGANTLSGGGGNDILTGGTGNDTMIGGLGNDYYFVDAAGDIITEAPGQGTDTVYAAVSYTLAGGVEVEMLQTTSAAGTGAINLTGNEYGQTITGNAGANTLSGGGGNDILSGSNGNDVLNGGAGSDALNGGAGNDSFQFTDTLGVGNVDTVVGYSIAEDTILVDDAVFTGLALGALAAGAFNNGAAASEADDRIIYNPATGALLFDPDGLGGVAGIQFATMSAGLAMTASEFIVI